jgi:hypothetical protein
MPFLLLPGSGERFHYLPSFGACLVLAAAGAGLVTRTRRRGARRLLAWAVVASGVVWLVAANLDRQSDWRLAARWTRGIVDRWGYFRALDPAAPVEFAGVPDHWRSAWVFRNGFASMVRLYWEGRPYWREEERPPGAPPAYRVRVVTRPDGTLAIVPVRGEGRGAEPPALRGSSGPGATPPWPGVDTFGDRSYSRSAAGSN